MPLARDTKGSLTRKKIEAIAIRLIAKKGFDSVSFQDIAKASRLSQSAVMRYFPSRQKLMEALILSIVSRNGEIVQKYYNSRSDAFGALLSHFQSNLRWALEFPDEASVILLLYYNASFQKPVQRLYESVLKGAREKIAVLVKKGKAEGRFQLALSPEETATLLHDALLGGIVNRVTQPHSGEPIEKIQGRWSVLIARLVGFSPST